MPILAPGPRRPWSRRSKTASTVKSCSPVDAQWLEGRRVERIVELDPDDPELKRAWASFPDPEADNSWEYLATELIEKHWVHIFLNLGTSARVPARSGWGP